MRSHLDACTRTTCDPACTQLAQVRRVPITPGTGATYGFIPAAKPPRAQLDADRPLVIRGADGREIFAINADGTVTGDAADATEAARLFAAEVQRIGEQAGLFRPPVYDTAGHPGARRRRLPPEWSGPVEVTQRNDGGDALPPSSAERFEDRDELLAHLRQHHPYVTDYGLERFGPWVMHEAEHRLDDGEKPGESS